MPRKDYLNLLAGLTPVTLTYGQVLYEPGQLIEHVYFPSDCLISLLTTVDGNRALGVGLIGREGMLGTPLALGIEFSSVRALVQASGTAMRMNAACFRKEVADSLPLQQRKLITYRRGNISILDRQGLEAASCGCYQINKPA